MTPLLVYDLGNTGDMKTTILDRGKNERQFGFSESMNVFFDPKQGSMAHRYDSIFQTF